MPSRPRAPSRADVARLAGVAPPTVSLVLNGRADEARIAKGTQQRVLDAARTLRYIPNSAARAMRELRHLTIGIIGRRRSPTLHLPIFEEFTMGVLERATDHNHNVKFLPPVDDEPYDVLATLSAAQVDGVLVHGAAQVFQSLVDWRVPTVFAGMGQHPDELPFEDAGGVTIDEAAGVRRAAQHLNERHHEHVGIVAGPHPRAGPVVRFHTFAEELATGTPAPDVTTTEAEDWYSAGGYRATKELLLRAPDITALHVGNDEMAVGALLAVSEAGRRVPDDIEVIGFGDFRFSAYLQPPLTTVHWPLTELGTMAVDKLLAQLGVHGPESSSSTEDGTGHTWLPTELIVRASTRGDP